MKTPAAKKISKPAPRPHPAAHPTSSGDGKQSLTDRAYFDLEELIVTLKLPPGSAVSEAALSERLGIGRTPIREALQRLARERLVTILPRRGIIVSEINVKSQLRLIELRREVERLVARSAARRANDEERQRFAELAQIFEKSAKTSDETTFIRADREFNDLCTQAARNEFCTGAMGLMHALSRRFWFLHYQKAADMPLTAKLHANIARAIAQGDRTAAGRAADKLLDSIAEFTRATVTTDF
jgi:DNA-binding GntR family transcriptional regulator